MRAVVQLVSRAEVTIQGKTVGSIGPGLVVLLGINRNDTEKEINYLADKIINLRIFPDQNEKMNLSVKDTKGEILLVSQFTLFGDCRKGRRPSYSNAAPPDRAKGLYDTFIKKLNDSAIPTATGEFQAMMKVNLVNNGPVTILLDSDKLF